MTSSNKLVTATDSGPVTIGLPRSYSILNPSIALNGLTFANTANGGGTITRSDSGGSWGTDGFVSGAQITVTNSNGNNGTYTVVSASGNVLTLAPAANNTPLFAQPGTDVSLVSVTSQGEVRLGASFSPTAVDSEVNTITFSTPHGFETGDEVVHDPQGGQTIGGLTPGATYYVHKVDDNTISLANTLAEAQATLGSFTAGDINGNTITAPGFTNGEQVTYYGPAPETFLPANVNVTTDSATGKFVPLNPTVSLSNMTFANAPGGDTITRNDSGGDWVAEGFTSGSKITINGDSGVNGTYTIASVHGATITLTTSSPPFTSPGLKKSPVTITQVAQANTIYLPSHGYQTGDAVTYTTTDGTNGVVTGLTQGGKYYVLVIDANDIQLTDAFVKSSQLKFGQDAKNGDTIDLPGTESWSDDGFTRGMTITVSGSSSNDGTYTIATVSGNSLVLTVKGQLTAGSDSNSVVVQDAPLAISGSSVSNRSAVQTLSAVGIGGLTDGQTYTVNEPDPTKDQFTLNGVTLDTTGYNPSLKNYLGTAGTIHITPVTDSSGPHLAELLYSAHAADDLDRHEPAPRPRWHVVAPGHVADRSHRRDNRHGRRRRGRLRHGELPFFDDHDHTHCQGLRRRGQCRSQDRKRFDHCHVSGV